MVRSRSAPPPWPRSRSTITTFRSQARNLAFGVSSWWWAEFFGAGLALVAASMPQRPGPPRLGGL